MNKILVNVVNEINVKREMREYNVYFSKMLFLLIFSKIEENKTALIDER
jgi:hypothetical protein